MVDMLDCQESDPCFLCDLRSTYPGEDARMRSGSQGSARERKHLALCINQVTMTRPLELEMTLDPFHL